MLYVKMLPSFHSGYITCTYHRTWTKLFLVSLPIQLYQWIIRLNVACERSNKPQAVIDRSVFLYWISKPQFLSRPEMRNPWNWHIQYSVLSANISGCSFWTVIWYIPYSLQTFLYGICIVGFCSLIVNISGCTRIRNMNPKVKSLWAI